MKEERLYMKFRVSRDYAWKRKRYLIDEECLSLNDEKIIGYNRKIIALDGWMMDLAPTNLLEELNIFNGILIANINL
jgi:hypothetical protein